MLVHVTSEPVDDVDFRGADLLEFFEKWSVDAVISRMREYDEQRVLDEGWRLR